MRPLPIAVTAVPMVAGLAAATAGPAVAAPSATTPRTVTATTIAAAPRTLAVGTTIRGSSVATRRTFLGLSFGVALASTGGADYPVQTGNGGRTWRTTGPALHVDAAQAPLSVTELGAATRTLQYAYGGGQVVDVTSSGGPTWRSALFNGTVVAVVPGARSGQLVAFVDGTSDGPTSQYVTRDGGRTWRLTTVPQIAG